MGTMHVIIAFIDDMGKRLSRPIKDLDDVRFTMKALKELREDEIKIDMSLGPIEVRVDFYFVFISLNLPTKTKKTKICL